MKNYKIDVLQNKTISWWYSKKDKIDMLPPYQRKGRLWSDADKAYLIDSILNGFDIPKLYVADFTWKESKLNKSNMMYAIIDGKQRFESIFDFRDGRIALNDDFVFFQNPKLPLAGLKFKDLLKEYPDIADIFQQFNLTVVGVLTDDDEAINELFVRLNRSKPLTGAEIRNAMAGPAPALIRNIASSEFFNNYVAFQTKRSQDLNAAAKLLLFEINSAPKETKKTVLDAFVKNPKSSSRDKLELATRRVIDNLDMMTDIFLPKDKLLNSAGLLPVYYWFIRNTPSEHYSILRNFLVEFEARRKENKKSSSDSELSLYEQHNRSTNDERSHLERVRILTSRFEKWIKSVQKSKV
jgi:hypothetical protein